MQLEALDQHTSTIAPTPAAPEGTRESLQMTLIVLYMMLDDKADAEFWSRKLIARDDIVMLSDDLSEKARSARRVKIREGLHACERFCEYLNLLEMRPKMVNIGRVSFSSKLGRGGVRSLLFTKGRGGNAPPSLSRPDADFHGACLHECRAA